MDGNEHTLGRKTRNLRTIKLLASTMNKVVTKKIRFPLDNHHSGYAGESVWADLIEDSVYQIKNIPVFAYGVNFDDHVLVEEDEDGILQVQKVIKRSSHHSLRVYFIDGKTGDENFQRLKKLKGTGVGSEKWDDELFAVNVTPSRDYEAFIDTLHFYQAQGVLEYELSGEWEGNFDGSESES